MHGECDMRIVRMREREVPERLRGAPIENKGYVCDLLNDDGECSTVKLPLKGSFTFERT